MTTLNNALQKLDLSEKETDIYLACLQLGSASVPAISAKSDLPKTTCYEILEKLRGKGFVSMIRKKTTKFYMASDPKVVLKKAKEKLSAFEDFIPQLCALYGSIKNKPIVRYYQNKEQTSIVFREILDEAKEVCGFGSADDVFKYMEDSYRDFLKNRVRKKIPIRLILNDTPVGRERQRLGLSQLRIVKLMPKLFDYHSIVYIWNNKIALFSLREALDVVVIEDKELANIQRAMFNSLWNRI